MGSAMRLVVTRSGPGRGRRFGWCLARLACFFRALLTERGLLSPEGRLAVRGKIRRAAYSFFPERALALRRRHGLGGACGGCGASCNLMFACPQWDPISRGCTIYDHRPTACRLFPFTPADLRERDLLYPHTPCGFAVLPAAAESGERSARAA